MNRLFHASCDPSLTKGRTSGAIGSINVGTLLIVRRVLVEPETRPDDRTLWESKIELGEKFFEESHSAARCRSTCTSCESLKRSSLGLDLYLWLTYRTFSAQGSATALVEGALPTVRRGPEQGNRPAHC